MSNKIDQILEEIAKIMLVTGDLTQNEGLYYGQTGAAIFLYNYYSYKENEVYASFADELVLSVTSSLNDKNMNYSNGLSGIAWAIDHLAEREHIDLPPDAAVFSNVDTSVLRMHPYINLGVESAGYASYLFARLKNYDKAGSGSLVQLLAIERLIAHIDEIDTMEGSGALPDMKDMFGHMEDESMLNLANCVERYATSAVLLKQAAKTGIGEGFVVRLTPVLKKKTAHIVKMVAQYLEKKAPDTYDHISQLDHHLLICFNAYLQLCEPSDDITTIFLSAIARMENGMTMAASRDNSQLNVEKEVNAITLLNRINMVLNEPFLTRTAAAKVEKLVDFLHRDSNLVNQFILNPVAINIGVTGLAGLGLMLLDHIRPDKTDWEKALLYN
jgi:hypothetical protein